MPRHRSRLRGSPCLGPSSESLIDRSSGSSALEKPGIMCQKPRPDQLDQLAVEKASATSPVFGETIDSSCSRRQSVHGRSARYTLCSRQDYAREISSSVIPRRRETPTCWTNCTRISCAIRCENYQLGIRWSGFYLPIRARETALRERDRGC